MGTWGLHISNTWYYYINHSTIYNYPLGANSGGASGLLHLHEGFQGSHGYYNSIITMGTFKTPYVSDGSTWTKQLYEFIHLMLKKARGALVGEYRTLRATSSKIIPKIDAENFGILLAIFAEYNINYFLKLPKSKFFLLLTRILLTT